MVHHRLSIPIFEKRLPRGGLCVHGARPRLLALSATPHTQPTRRPHTQCVRRSIAPRRECSALHVAALQATQKAPFNLHPRILRVHL